MRVFKLKGNEMRFLRFLIVALFSTNSFAGSVIIDFNSLGDAPFDRSFDTYTEEGYLLDVRCFNEGQCNTGTNFFIESTTSSDYKGSPALHPNQADPVRLTALDKSVFNLNSIDLADTGGDFFSLNFRGTKSDLSTVSQTFTGTGNLLTYNFIGFDDLINVEWGATRRNESGLFLVTFDNINISTGKDSISTVPVPAAAWLFGSALIGFAGFRRKSV